MPVAKKNPVSKKFVDEEEEEVSVPIKKTTNGTSKPVKKLAQTDEVATKTNGSSKRKLDDDEVEDEEAPVPATKIQKAVVKSSQASSNGKSVIKSFSGKSEEPAEDEDKALNGASKLLSKEYKTKEEFYKNEAITFKDTIQKSEFEPVLSFSALPESLNTEFVRRHIEKMKYVAPSPIQSVTWPLAVQGKDLVGIAMTGSGKTFAFLLAPMVNLYNETKNKPKQLIRGFQPAKPKLLVMAPTRELAVQIQEQSAKLCQAANTGLRSAVVYGGADKFRQRRELEGCNILIATPGRLIDFLHSGVIDLSELKTIVLDEADRMMDMGFEPQIREVLTTVPAERQTLMFSATWPKSVRQISEQFFNSPVQCWIGSTSLNANPNITQKFLVVAKKDALAKLDELLPGFLEEGKGLIFTNQKSEADELTYCLTRARYKASCIHGDKEQFQRERTLKSFNTGQWQIIVATDVAARGLDFKDVKWVINWQFPLDIESYVHRIGRTARAGNTGTSFTFLDPNECPKGKIAKKLVNIVQKAGQQVDRESMDLLQKGISMQDEKWGRGRRSGAFGGRGGRGGYGNRDGGYGNRDGGYGGNRDGGYGNRNGNSGGYGNRDGGYGGNRDGGYGGNKDGGYGGNRDGNSRGGFGGRGRGFGGGQGGRGGGRGGYYNNNSSEF